MFSPCFNPKENKGNLLSLVAENLISGLEQILWKFNLKMRAAAEEMSESVANTKAIGISPAVWQTGHKYCLYCILGETEAQSGRCDHANSGKARKHNPVLFF